MAEDLTLQKLENLLGVSKAEELTAELFEELGIDALSGPADRLRFGEALIARGGVLEAIGRSLKVQVLLQGGSQPKA